MKRLITMILVLALALSMAACGKEAPVETTQPAAEGGKVTYTYDALGRVVKAVNEDGAVTEYEYDAKGRTVAIKDAYGNYRRFEYDPMDRIVADTDEKAPCVDGRRTDCTA